MICYLLILLVIARACLGVCSMANVLLMDNNHYDFCIKIVKGQIFIMVQEDHLSKSADVQFFLLS